MMRCAAIRERSNCCFPWSTAMASPPKRRCHSRKFSLRTTKSSRSICRTPKISLPPNLKEDEGAAEMSAELRAVEALLRRDFRAFLHKVAATLSPGQRYIRTWHVEAIAWQLERVRRGEVRRLIINMPPRSLKSITASVAFPAFVLGHDS